MTQDTGHRTQYTVIVHSPEYTYTELSTQYTGHSREYIHRTQYTIHRAQYTLQ